MVTVRPSKFRQRYLIQTYSAVTTQAEPMFADAIGDAWELVKGHLELDPSAVAIILDRINGLTMAVAAGKHVPHV